MNETMDRSIRRANERYHNDHGWLKTHFSFSFADYYDPNNIQFSALRVLNDDNIAPGTGFDLHPHRDMEIVTVVLKGQLEHRDTTGNREIIVPGQIQRMSAGTGIYHGEFNASDTESLQLMQLWFLPEKMGLQPSYETFTYGMESIQNRLVPVVSNRADELGTARIHQDVTLQLGQFAAGQELAYVTKPGRSLYLFIIEGEVRFDDGMTLHRRDDARIRNAHSLKLQFEQDSHIMLIDLS
ncbi:pirin family protein [Paenibacillus sp. MER TA 81-3]|uniref:pirin family protein n=1 Tax=Paenibacillus sp. MER TA 81-3 TaxID=2939573 RepID=UPI00203E1BB7|nr:pirin family protein [Paenibacillus sp. MER TA 81-3]MCM3339194.1 pirin family protein [Paenibacillus sp. MER TA 81-3]